MLFSNSRRNSTLHRCTILGIITLSLLVFACAVSAQGFSDLTSLQTGFGSPITAHTARSLALGGTGIASLTTPDALAVNPAMLAWGEGSAEALLSGRISRQQESRSYPVYDSFDAVLVYNQYTLNDHLFSEANGAVRFTIPQEMLPSLAVGVGTFSVYSHDYRYKEEVRDRFASGGIQDRVLGWNTMESEGEVRTVLLGVGVEPTPNLALGMNIGMVLDNLGTTWSLDFTDPEAGEIFIREDQETDGMEWMVTLGGAYKVSPRVNLGFRASLPVGEWNLTYDWDSAGGFLVPMDETITYKYPMSLGWGVEYRPMNQHRPALMLDIHWTNWSAAEVNGEDTGFDDVLEIRAGVEYRVFQTIPVRLGCSYVPSYLDRELTMTMISLGTGFQAGRFNLDLGTDFGRREYRLDDAFHDSYYGGESRTDRDRVEDRLMNGIISVTYTFN